jgi:uncharacterized protein (TIGR00369 family)
MNQPLTGAATTAALQRIAYARFLGLRAELESQTVTLILPYKEELIGNPAIPALHGGVIGAFLEITAVMQIALVRRDEAGARHPKTIDIAVDYLRPGRAVDTYAQAHVTKLGRRIANVRAEAWQRDRARPIATMRGNFLIERAG